MSRHPQRMAQWVRKVLAFCIVLCAFTTLGALPMQTTTPTYASEQKNQANTLDIPTVPVPTVSVPIPTLPPDPLDTPTPKSTATPTPEPEDTPTPEATPTHTATPTPKPTRRTTPVPTPTDQSSSESAPKATPTAIARPVTQPTPASNGSIPVTPTPAANQSVPTKQPTSSLPTPSVTSAVSTASTATPTTTPKSSTPTTQRDQGTMAALIITSGLSATTLLTAGALIGVQTRKKRKRAAALAESQAIWPDQGGIFNPAHQASSPHLIDQNLMMPPAMQEILQQSPSLFMADEPGARLTEIPGQIDEPATAILAQHSLSNEPASIIDYPTELLATSDQHSPEAHSGYYTEPMITSVYDTPEVVSEHHTEPQVISIRQENTDSLASLPQDIRTDPTLNAMKKQAQMGIFVLLDQEKNNNQSSFSAGRTGSKLFDKE